MKNILIILLLLGSIVSARAVQSDTVRDGHVAATLISEVTSIQAGTSFWVALKLEHDEHWHTYWVNDGDSGLPTSIRWELPDGFAAGDIVWPYPMRLEMDPLVSFGYEDEAWLLVQITPPATLAAGEQVVLNARVSWLMCKEICIPGRASFSLTLPVRAVAAKNAAQAENFASARRQLPVPVTLWRFSTEWQDDQVVLTATAPAGATPVETLDVFPVDKGLFTYMPAPAFVQDDQGFRVILRRENTVAEPPDRLRLVLVASPTLAADTAYPAVVLDIPRQQESVAAPVERGVLAVSLLAFLGGIILNLMPCVFPVISLKILGFVKQAGEDPRAVWRHGLVFASGVLVSFWLLAGLLMVLRAGGASIGWGFQLQSPEVLIGLSLLFVILALNLFGVFEVGVSLTSAGGGAAQKQGWAGSFFSGFLATVIATPCTAPFMGVALGYALTQPPYVAFTVFTALALGMAFPYLLLSRYPALLKRLPRPGMWMETMKQIMGFFLLATVVWLFWVLSALAAPSTLVWVVAAFLLAGMGVWTIGKWDNFARSTGVRWAGRVAGLALLGTGVMVGLGNISAASGDAGSGGEWEAFSPERLTELRAEGRPVFIDFTAKWCLTCQVNKLTVLRTSDIMAAFREKGVALLYADWTDENEVIARELQRYGRQSVPVYALYAAGAADAVLLPEILTRGIVVEALKNLN